MDAYNLIAPARYNISHELEKFKDDEDRQAIRWIDAKGNRQTLSYKHLIEQMNQYANALTSLGLNKGDRVLIMMPRVPEAYKVYLSCLKAGLVAIACSEMLRASDLEYRMQHAEAKAVVVYQGLTEDTWVFKLSDKSILNKKTEDGDETFYGKLISGEL